MSPGGPSDIFARPAAAALAFLVLVAATVLLEKNNPKKEIKGRFDQKYCCQFNPAKPNPYFSTDSAFGFTPANLYSMLDEYGPEDVEDHRQFIIYDFFYPFAYAVPFAIFILFFQRELSPRRVRWLPLLPLGAAVFDLIENAGMWAVLGAGAETSAPQDALVYVAALGNVLKWLLVLSSFLLICSGLVGYVLKRAFGVEFKPQDGPQT
jgi:hypothetical protein